MPAPAMSNEAFIGLIDAHGVAGTARLTGIDERSVRRRRGRLEERLDRRIIGPYGGAEMRRPQYEGRLCVDLPEGIILVASDAHYGVGPPSLMHRAFVHFCHKLKPALIVQNGDVCDFGRISRHPPIGWSRLPDPAEEIETARQRLREIVARAPGARFIWTLGNHDSRYETRLAERCPEYAEIHGFKLKDHFPEWEPTWSVWVNDDLVIKHRFKGGLHAVHNNALWTGRSTCTGHLHSQQVSRLTDLNGTRYGVDTGCLADPFSPLFQHWMEDNPRNWREGFAVFRYHCGRLMPPFLVEKWDKGTVCFRGELIRV